MVVLVAVVVVVVAVVVVGDTHTYVHVGVVDTDDVGGLVVVLAKVHSGSLARFEQMVMLGVPPGMPPGKYAHVPGAHCILTGHQLVG
jgi:hypothetical protein